MHVRSTRRRRRSQLNRQATTILMALMFTASIIAAMSGTLQAIT